MWNMLRRLIGTGQAAALLAVVWFLASRWCALIVGQFYTPRLATLQATPLGWDGITLQFGPPPPDFAGPLGHGEPPVSTSGHHVDFIGMAPDYKMIPLPGVDAARRLVARQGRVSLVLGPGAGTMRGPDGSMPALVAEPGDRVSAVLDRSLLGWPAPYQVNWMTGYTPDWQRYLYYRLSWEKASGARLAIVRRYPQDWDRGQRLDRRNATGRA